MYNQKMKSNSGQRLYPADNHSVFPTFKLLPSSSLGPNPVWRIRPPKSTNESVPTISSIYSTKRDGEAEDVDMEEKWLETDWVIECIEEDGIAGVIVSRNWLGGSEHEEKEQVSSTIRLENLLVSVLSKEDNMKKTASKVINAVPSISTTNVSCHPTATTIPLYLPLHSFSQRREWVGSALVNRSAWTSRMGGGPCRNG